MNNTLVLSISLGTGCYRHVKICSSSTLYELHQFILEIFEFDDDHLHAFFMSNSFWDKENGYYSPYLEGKLKFSTDFKLCDFNLEKGSKFLYVFDFGDEWRFSIKVLRLESEAIKMPIVIKSVGEAPCQYEDYDDEEDEDDVFNVHSPFVSSEELKRPLSVKEQKRADLLNKYALAATNLYGIIPQNEFVSIFNSHNEEKTSVDEVFKTLLRYVYDWVGYCFYEEYIVHYSFEDDDFKSVADLARASLGKLRFIPTKDEFVKFSDKMYTDNPIHLVKVRKFLENTFGENDNVLNLYLDIAAGCSNDDTFDEIMNLFEEHSLQFENMEQVKTFMYLITGAQNNSRLWVNKGYTPNELGKLYTSQPVKAKKTGRNEPCPCGSGKKYKKCCGK